MQALRQGSKRPSLEYSSDPLFGRFDSLQFFGRPGPTVCSLGCLPGFVERTGKGGQGF